jgi:hypothetical protein
MFCWAREIVFGVYFFSVRCAVVLVRVLVSQSNDTIPQRNLRLFVSLQRGAVALARVLGRHSNDATPRRSVKLTVSFTRGGPVAVIGLNVLVVIFGLVLASEYHADLSFACPRSHGGEVRLDSLVAARTEDIEFIFRVRAFLRR